MAEKFKMNKKGVSIVAIVGIMLILSIIGLVGVSLLGSTSNASVNYLQSQQAFYIADAGAEWYLERLQNDSDWRTPPPVPTSISPLNFGGGSFYITTSNANLDYINITSTGRIIGYENQPVKRVLTMRVDRTGMVVSEWKESL